MRFDEYVIKSGSGSGLQEEGRLINMQEKLCKYNKDFAHKVSSNHNVCVVYASIGSEMWGEEVANFPSIVILTKRNKQHIYSDTHTRQKINTNKEELEKKKKEGD